MVDFAQMVEPVGTCEKHQLPLDRSGECELCRLGDMPSSPPPVRSRLWLVLLPLVVAVLGAVWALSTFNPVPGTEEAPAADADGGV